jgi:hypothetical protein
MMVLKCDHSVSGQSSGVRMTVAADQGRDLAGLVEVLDAEKVEIIPPPQ